MVFRVLGPVEVESGDGRAGRPRGPKQRLLLAARRANDLRVYQDGRRSSAVGDAPSPPTF